MSSVTQDEILLVSNLRALREDSERDAALTNILDIYKGFIHFVKSKRLELKDELVQSHTCLKRLGEIIQLLWECPFVEVRTELLKVMQLLQEVLPGFKIRTSARVSSFIGMSKIVPLDSSKQDIKDEFEAAFRTDGRVSNMTRVMAFHPEYLAAFREAHNSPLWMEGPIGFIERHLLAIIAASRYDCTYLVQIHQQHFLDLGGDPEWLAGPTNLPTKFQSILLLNSQLAYQPFVIKQESISSLLTSQGGEWTVPELAHAGVILTHFHALCSFIYGLGILPEVDFQDHVIRGEDAESESDEDDDSQDLDINASNGIHTLNGQDIIDVLKSLKEDSDGGGEDEEEEESEDKKLQSSVDVTDFDSDDDDSSPQVTGAGLFDPVEPIRYRDFDIHSDRSLQLRSFSWSDHGYTILSRHISAFADHLDNCFNVIKNLTYGFVGDAQNVKTFEFRWAVWNYVLRILGIIDADYHYRRINEVLTRPMKSFAKRLIGQPHTVTLLEFRQFFPRLKDSERVHFILLVMEAKRQAELLFFLRSFSRV